MAYLKNLHKEVKVRYLLTCYGTRPLSQCYSRQNKIKFDNKYCRATLEPRLNRETTI